MKTTLVFILLSTLALGACAPRYSGKPRPEAVAGVLDLRGWSFDKDGPLNLDGQWEFYWEQLFSTKPIEQNPDQKPDYFAVPAYWNGRPQGGGVLAGTGFATFRVNILLDPGHERHLALFVTDALTAHRTFVNNLEVARNGTVATDQARARPQYLPQIAELPDGGETLELVVQVANFHHRNGGIWNAPRLGLEKDLRRERERTRDLELFLFGALLIMGTYHLTLFALRRSDRSALFFGLFCIALVLRILVTGDRYLIQNFPDLPFEFFSKIEYLSFQTSIPLFAMFTASLFPARFDVRVLRFIQICAVGFALLVLFTPVAIYSYSVTFYYVLTVVGCSYALYIVTRAVFHKEEGAILFLSGFAALFAAAINDILYNELIIRSTYLAPAGLWLFIFAQATLLARHFAGAFRRVQTLSVAFERFVPRDFLKHLNKESIVEVGLGDAVQKEMTVLFSDLRNFSTLSETMRPSENFAFLNAVYRRVGPVIREHGGFIDKYIGDGIMALFPEQPADAIRAAVAMQKLVTNYNIQRVADGHDPIAAGFGIHSGSLMLGTVGEPQRMDSTVISDAVNLASRLEGVSKILGAKIVVSQSCVTGMTESAEFGLRPLGRMHVKGRRDAVTIFEVFSGEDERSARIKSATRPDFEEGLRCYHARSFARACEHFQAALTALPDDLPARHYLQRSTYLLDHPPSDDWDGTLQMHA